MIPHPLITFVASTHGVTAEQVLSRSRRAEVSRARALTCYLLHLKQEYNLSAIGRLLGLDHSSVSYAVDRVAGDPTLRQDARTCYRLLESLAQQAQGGHA